jgi:hypothetical protein
MAIIEAGVIPGIRSMARIIVLHMSAHVMHAGAQSIICTEQIVHACSQAAHASIQACINAASIAGIPVIAPARREEKVHDMQTKTEVARSGFLVEQSRRRRSAHVPLRLDPRLQRIGLDLDEVLTYSDGGLVSADRRTEDQRDSSDRQAAHHGAGSEGIETMLAILSQSSTSRDSSRLASRDRLLA